MTCGVGSGETGLCERTQGALTQILRCIVPAMFKSQQPWALMGSTASVLQGLRDYTPPDIDLATTMEGAYVMEGCIAAAGTVTRPVAYSVRAPYASYFGVFEVGGVKVEVMGDLVIRCPDGVIDSADHWARWSDQVRIVHVEGFHIPVVPLEWQLLANALLGRAVRVEGIARYLNREGYDQQLFRELCQDVRLGERTIGVARKALHCDT
ncbi:MAG TPA: hypothetical protein VFC53_10065 [Dehalococcoidia bacterium]|jgi:hypothetical protein|nr:hypothetical protein [Dehalococcoidia bacterium]